MPHTASPIAASSRRAFTLIELLVVISIVSLLMAILVSAIGRSRLAALDTQCKSNLRQLMMATTSYASDAGGAPPMAGYQNTIDYPSLGRYFFDVNTRRVLFDYAGQSCELFVCPRGEVRVPYANGYKLRTYWFDARWYQDPTWVTSGVTWTDYQRAILEYGYWLGPGRGQAGNTGVVQNMSYVTRIDTAAKPSSRMAWNDCLMPPGVMNGSYSGAAGITWTFPSNTHDIGGNAVPEGGNYAMLDGHVEWRPYSDTVNWVRWNFMGYNYK